MPPPAGGCAAIERLHIGAQKLELVHMVNGDATRLPEVWRGSQRISDCNDDEDHYWIKTESGAKLKVSATGIYKKWQQKTHKSINTGGKSGDYAEERTSSTGGYHKGNKKFPGASRGRRSIPNADVPSETRNPEQMQKGRQQKAKEILRLKDKSGKDGKFPNKFQKNRRSDREGNGRPGSRHHGKGRGVDKGNGKGPSKAPGGKGKMKRKGAPR